MVRVVYPAPDTSAKLMAIEEQAFRGREVPWVADDYAWLGTPPQGAVITDDAIETGLIVVNFAADEAEIVNLAVVPRVRRQGLARELLEAAEALADSLSVVRMFLEVAVDNDAARALYEGAGYEQVGLRKAYYLRADGARTDALVLSKTLGGGA